MLRMMAVAVVARGLSQASARAAGGPARKAASIELRYCVQGGKKWGEVVGTVKNVGNRAFASWHRDHEGRLDEGRTLRQTQRFGPVAVGGTVVVRYARPLSPGDSTAPPTFTLRIDYEPD